MKKQSSSRSAFFNPRALAAFSICSTGALLAVVGFSTSVADSVRNPALKTEVSGPMPAAPLAGTWTATGSMTTARFSFTATLLNNGKVLVAGGYDVSGNSLASAELYDPSTGTWTPTASMSTPRGSLTATLLTNGKVLVAGGSPSYLVALSSSELYDPDTATWTATGSMNGERFAHQATLIPNGPLAGKVLVAGGANTGYNPQFTAELYDPNTGLWTETGSMTIERFWDGPTSSATLADGSILIVGGTNCCPYHWLNEAEVYDPVSETWTPTSAKMTYAKYATASLPNNLVLVAGGTEGSQPTAKNVPDAELFDSASGTWAATAKMSTDRSDHTLTLLGNGQALVAGGASGGWGVCNDLTSAELYDSSAGKWLPTGDMNVPRHYHTATLFPNGQVLVAGGADCEGHVWSSAELYTPPTLPGTWTATGSMNHPRFVFTATLLNNGKVLAAGGADTNFSSATASTELYDSATGNWTSTGDMTTPRVHHKATLLPDGKVLVSGGQNPSSAISSAELYDPATGLWTLTGSMNTPRSGHMSTLITTGPLSGMVLVAGGDSTCEGCATPLDSAELYDPSTGLWTYTGSMTLARYWDNPSPTTLADGSILIVGGVNPFGGTYHWLNEAEIYDPTTQTWTPTNAKLTNANERTVLLPNNLALVAGGVEGSAPTSTNVAEAELFDSATGTWAATGEMSTDRSWHTLTLLGNGQALVAGGFSGGWGVCNNLTSAELYDSSLGTWSLTGSMTVPRQLGSATLLPNGQVLTAGGADCAHNIASSAELYTPLTPPPQITLRAAGRKVNGVDTVLLIWSGATSSQVDIYRCVQRLHGCDPVVIATTTNDGRYIDSTGHTRQAGFRYKVCEAGTQTCSKAAGVTFER